MNLIALIVLLIVAGVAMYYVRASSKIDPNFKTIIYGVVIVAFIVLLLQIAGVWSEIKNFRVGG